MRLTGCVLAGMFFNTAAHAAVLFQDDFNGSTLDGSKWSLGTWTLGRTGLGNAPVVAGGIASLQFDTYNPDSPGTQFRGTEIYSNQSFARGSGLQLTARVRTRANIPSGLVTSFFTYAAIGPVNDEIDFEALTKQIHNRDPSGDALELTTWNNWNDAHPEWFNDGIHNSGINTIVPGLDLTTFNTYEIRWLPDHTEWYVNGTLVRSTTAALADDPMPMRLNFWAPSISWAAAYDAALTPAASAGANSTSFYDVDFVTVSSIPEPSAGWALSLALLCVLRRRARVVHRQGMR